MTRVLLLLTALVLAGGCVNTAAGAGPTPAALDFGGALSGGGPAPDDPPADLLVEQPPKRQADRLIQKTRQVKEFCEAVPEMDAVEEPPPHDVEKVGIFATQMLSVVQTVKERSRVKNPDRREDEMDLPPALWEDVQAVRRAIYAFSVRVAYIGALSGKGRIDRDEVAARLDRANVILATSEYTAAYRRLVTLRPRYC